MSRILYSGVATLAVLSMMTEVALAGNIAVAPGPIAGAGAPALLVVAGSYWLVRRMRQRGK